MKRIDSILPFALLATVTMAVPAPAVPLQDALNVAATAPTADRDPAETLARQLRLLAAEPNNLEALIGAGRAAVECGDANAAIGFWGRADQLSPRDPRIKAGMASALVQAERPRVALRLFDQAVALGVPEATIAADRGLAYDLQGNTKRAQHDYALALAARNDPETVRRLALSKAMAGDKAGALATLDPLLRRQDPAAWRARAFALALTGDSAGAVQAASQVLPLAQAQAMAPFLAKLAGLRADQKAAAVHFGDLPGPPGSPVRYADDDDSGPAIARAAGSSTAQLNAQEAARVAATDAAPIAPATPPRVVVAAASSPRAAPLPAPRAAAAQALPSTAPAARATVATPTPALRAAQAAAMQPAAQPTAIVAQQVPPPPQASVAAAPAVITPAPVAAVVPSERPPTAVAFAQAAPLPSFGPAPAVTPASGPSATAAGSSTAPPALPTPAPAVAQATAPGLDRPVTIATAALPPSLIAPRPAPPRPAPAQAVAVRSAPARGAAAGATLPLRVRNPVLVADLAALRDRDGDEPSASGSSSRTATGRGRSEPRQELADARPATRAAVRARGKDERGSDEASVAPAAEAKGGTARAGTRDRLTEGRDASTRADAKTGGKATRLSARDDEETGPKPTRKAGGKRGKPDQTADDRTDDATGDDRAAASKAAAGKGRAAAKGDRLAARDTDEPARPAKAGTKGKPAGKDADDDAATGSAKNSGKGSDKAATRTAAKGSTKAKAAPERIWVQVAGGANKDDLDKEWSKLRKASPDLYAGKTAHAASYRYTNRLLVGPFKSDDEAQAYVNKLSRAGRSGFAVTSKPGEEVDKLDAGTKDGKAKG